MIPDSLATLYAFLGLIAPGLVYQLIRERRRPSWEETPFREAGRVALTSLVFTTASILILVGLRRFTGLPVADLSQWLTGGRSDLAAHFSAAFLTVVAGVGLACLLALIGEKGTYHLGKRWLPPIQRSSIWQQHFVETLPEDKAPWLALELNDGTRLWGWLDFYTVGQALENREISLKGPGLSLQQSSEFKPHGQVSWQFITLRASDIKVMNVAHHPKQADPTVAEIQ